MNKRSVLLKKELAKANKIREKAVLERDKTRSSLTNMKKKKMPQITAIMKQIDGWEKIFKAGSKDSG
ncbi:hypothetical protein Ct9H90mP29_06580 [bacterium]|nr:MAG: hypothetical protein Ct9H90mP29_06580 [bacterium]